MAAGSGMAIPETFKFILVALAGMVVYRFVNELQGPGMPEEGGNATIADSEAPAVSDPVSAATAAESGHALETATQEAAPAKSGKGGSKVATNVRRHSLKKNQVLIEFCTSWQYKSTYNQVVQIIHTRALANLEVRGAEYPPPPDKVFYSRVVFYVQMAAFMFVFLGESVLGTFKIEPPAFLNTLKDNKFASFMFIWLIGNMVQGSLLSTGAFEIHHGDQLIWSSLEEKRLPNMGDLLRAFEKTGVEFMKMQRDEK